jgi:hypothetical protein
MGFSFNTCRESADKFDTLVYKNAEFFTDIFKNKYGQPARCLKPSFLSVVSGKIALLCEWETPDLVIYTGFTTRDLNYFAEAHVR